MSTSSTAVGKPEFSPFAKTFISYGSYHHNLINKIIHIICIPIITATFLGMLTYIPWHFELFGYQIGVFHIACALSLIYYATIGIGAAAIMATAIGIGSFIWQWYFHGKQSTQIRNTLILLNVVGWGFQFIGHGFFQKRKPALLDNIFQIYSAPLFVIIELFDLIGLRTKEMQRWKEQIEVKVKQFKQGKTEAKVKN